MESWGVTWPVGDSCREEEGDIDMKKLCPFRSRMYLKLVMFRWAGFGGVDKLKHKGSPVTGHPTILMA